MQFRTADAKGFGITFARADPKKDEARIRQAVQTDLGERVAGEIRISRGDLPLQPDQRPAYLRLLDPKLVASFAFEIQVPLAQRGPLDMTLALHENIGGVATVIGQVMNLGLTAAMPGPLSLDARGALTGSDDARRRIEPNKDLVKQLRRLLRESYTIGQLTIFASPAVLRLEPAGSTAQLMVSTLPSNNWLGTKPSFGLAPLLAAAEALEAALAKP